MHHLPLLCFQGIIQDVKLIFAPNGYITQCPNLNRSKYDILYNMLSK